MSEETIESRHPLKLAWSAPAAENKKPESREATPEEQAEGRKKIAAEADRATGKFLEFVNRKDFTQETFRKALSRFHDWIGWGFLVDPDLQVDLARKVHEHREFISKRQRRKVIATVIECVDEESPVLFDFVIDLMKSGDRDWCEALADRYLLGTRTFEGPPETFRPAVEAALAEGTAPALGRALAVLFLGLAGLPVNSKTAGPLLRDESWTVRLLAFGGLSRAGCLTEADLEFILRAHLAMPSRDRDEDDPWGVLHYWNTELEQAMGKLRPASCLPLLLELAAGPMRRFLTPSAGTQMLARVFPDRALPFVDAELRDFSSLGRRHALHAVARLPPADAIPRLERAASDPVPSVSKAALASLTSLGRTFRVGPSAAIPQRVLEGPPSIGFARRLVTARQEAVEPRRALRDELVAEAKAGRATAEDALLFVMLLCDSDLQHNAPVVEGPVGSFASWMIAMRPHFGPALGLSLAALEQRFDITGWGGPFGVLRELAKRGLLGDEERDAVRQLAARMFLSKAKPAAEEGRTMLASLGAPESCWDELFALFDSFMTRDSAREALARAAPSPELDSRIARQLSTTGTPDQREQLLLLGIARKLPAAIEEARASIQSATLEKDVYRASRLVPPLLRAGATSVDSLLGGLEDPKSARFELALAAAHELARWDARTAAALTRVLEHGSGPALRDVLILFINRRLIATNDPRLPDILTRLEPGHRRAALGLMLLAGGDPTPLESQLAEAIRSDPEAARVLTSLLETSDSGRAMVARNDRARRS